MRKECHGFDPSDSTSTAENYFREKNQISVGGKTIQECTVSHFRENIERKIPVIRVSISEVGVLDFWKVSGVDVYGSEPLIPKLHS